MIATGIAVTDPGKRAEIIYTQARASIDGRLWRAALGSATAPDPVGASDSLPPLDLTTLIGLFASADPPPPATVPPVKPQQAAASQAQHGEPRAGFGSNLVFSASISSAADRAGIPAPVLASIIDAEAAKNHDGSWRPTSRNARSTAAGLGQFLSGTWRSEAERAGTWLNETARRNGWLGADGRVLATAHAALLELRNDAVASINATADYASHSLSRLAAAGIVIGTTAEQIAHAAYLGHNLGIADAVRFLRGSLDEGRAHRLLEAQLGHSGAVRRIADAGGAAAAHRGWLLGFLARHVDPSRFSSEP